MAGPVTLEFRGELWRWTGHSAWAFVTVPQDLRADLQAAAALLPSGRGMISVQARTGNVVCATSLLPVLAGVRRAAQLDAGQTVTVKVHVQPRAASALASGTRTRNPCP